MGLRNAFDGDVNTIWDATWSYMTRDAYNPNTPHELVLALGAGYHLGGSSCVPRQDPSSVGFVKPDVMAPSAHLLMNLHTSCQLVSEYPGL
ncbi:MAG: hypothetical protein AAF639_18240 [Chloroflexota bacterium]